MLRARRIASIAVVAGLGLAALTGCRSDPSVAAYVGPEQISEAQVDRLVEEFFTGASDEQRDAADEGQLRDEVVHVLVLRAAMAQYAEANDVTVQRVDPDQFAQERGLQPGSELAEVLAGYSAVVGAVQQSAEPVAPSEEDRREAFDNATLQDRPLSDSYQYEDVKQHFSDEALAPTLGMREVIGTAVRDADVKVNPRYNSVFKVRMQISGAESFFAVPLGGGGMPVHDDPLLPAEPAAPQEQSDQG